jgi:hypothetical protein
MVLAIATLLVVGVARMLGGSGGGSGPADRGDTAAQAADHGAAGADPTASSSRPPKKKHRHHPKQADDPTTSVVMPSGPCEARDVAITPSVPHPVGGRDIAIVLDISSLDTPACTWTLSSTSLAMKITSGSDLIWTTAQCRRAIPTKDLVLRQDSPTRVRLTWDARRSEPGCPVQTEWAHTGTYHLQIAALGGQPQEATFLLTAPDQTDSTTSTAPTKKGDNPGHGKKTRKKQHHPPPG